MAESFTLRPRSLQLQLEGPHEHEHEHENGDDDDDANADLEDRPRTAPRSLHLNGHAMLNRSSTGLFVPNSRGGSRNPSPSPARGGRPGLLRARSDFGPRREEARRGSEGSEHKEGEWGLRHGFETQLESEEYNRLLESVRGRIA